MPFTAEDMESGKKMPLFARDNIVSLAGIFQYTQKRATNLLVRCLKRSKANILIKLTRCLEFVGNKEEPPHLYVRGSNFIYDKDRVHDSDIKKLIKWYNILRKAGMEQFCIYRAKRRD